MVEVRRPSLSQDINRGARHTLFVEGKFDVDVLRTFFDAHPLRVELRVEPFGPSFSVRAAADALHRHHPEYYFLIDRDHCDDATVERSWQKFPDPDTSNILLWRRRELENYFIIPEYLLRSDHLRVSEPELRACIRNTCARRLYLDAANHVVIALRETFKANWIRLFERPEEFPDRDAALLRLHDLSVLGERRDSFTAAIAPDALQHRLDDVLTLLTASQPTLDDDHGLWRERVRGKDVLSTVIQSCFEVRSARGSFLQGYERIREVARALVKRPLADQPNDLRALHNLLADRLAARPS
jgi:hypothetical protein